MLLMGKELGLFTQKGGKVAQYGYPRLGKYFPFCAQKSRLGLVFFLPLETQIPAYILLKT